MCYSDLFLWMLAYPDRVVLILMILTVAGVTALWWLDEGEYKKPVTENHRPDCLTTKIFSVEECTKGL